MKYPNTAFELQVSFSDLQGNQHSVTCSFDGNDDEWTGAEIEDKAFEINAFEVDGELQVNVYELDPTKKKGDKWVMDGMQELVVMDFFHPVKSN